MIYVYNLPQYSHDIQLRSSDGRNPAMHCEIRLHSKGVSIMWPLTHISAGLDPERGMITANGV